MWGDADHIKKLKQGEPPWPSDFPDPKKAKEQAKAARAAEKAADAEARALARWSQMPPAKPAKQPPATARLTATDLANLKAEAWEAKRQQKAMKDAWRAQKELLKAEKDAAKMARWQADEDRRLQREMAAMGKAAKQRGMTRPTSEASDYAYAYAPSATGCGLSGCAGPALALLLLLLLFLCICNCG